MAYYNVLHKLFNDGLPCFPYSSCTNKAGLRSKLRPDESATAFANSSNSINDSEDHFAIIGPKMSGDGREPSKVCIQDQSIFFIWWKNSLIQSDIPRNVTNNSIWPLLYIMIIWVITFITDILYTTLYYCGRLPVQYIVHGRWMGLSSSLAKKLLHSGLYKDP